MTHPESGAGRVTDPDGTQRVDGAVAARFDPDTTYQLPDRVALDPTSAAALAIAELLPEMLEGPDGATAIDVRRLAAAALATVEGLPTIPRWEGPRAVGGAARPPLSTDPLFTVDVRGPAVVLTAEIGDEAEENATVPPADARAWALAVLAACAVAEQAGPYLTPDDRPTAATLED